jgi:hypothetical protein
VSAVEPKAAFVPTPLPALNLVAPAAPPPETQPTPEYELALEFAQLKSQMGPVMGDPIGPEQTDDDNCNTQQLTTTGLAYWQCSTNLTGFAAYPDGAVHWALAPPGLLEWTGDASNPPSDAPLVVASGSGDDDPAFTAACLAARRAPALTCEVDTSMYAMATLQNPGDTQTFGLSGPSPGVEVIADLVDLPADYDLYLADDSGMLLAESIEEGTVPRHIDVELDGGTYYLYVHSDPGRSVDAQQPFRLQVRVSGAAGSAPQPDATQPAPSNAH